MNIRLMLAITIFAVSAASFAATSDDQAGNEPTPTGFKVDLVEPKAGPTDQLKLSVNKPLRGVVRVVGLDKDTTSNVVFFRFMRGSAMGGEFIGKPKRIDDRTVEYTADLKAPPAPGSYTLTIVPGDFTPSQKKPPGRAKYPTLKVVVSR